MLDRLLAVIADHVPAPYPADWVALKLLEGDDEITQLIREALPGDRWDEVREVLRQHEDAIVAVASGRYAWIERMTRAALTRPRAGPITLTQRLDRVATHPFGGLLVLAAVLAAVFGLTYAVGAPIQE